MMPATVIVGAQWGDEGKGRVVDNYAEGADLIARFGERYLALQSVQGGEGEPGDQ